MDREEWGLSQRSRVRAAKEIGHQAGILLGRMFGKTPGDLKRLELEIKPEDGMTPRTVIDKNVGKLIVDAIREAFPDDTIIAEDVKGITGTNGWTWWVDPFDGTANAEGQFPWSVTGIGVSFEGEMVIGVVANPFEATVTYAAKGHGAFVCDLKIEVDERPIHVSSGRPFARRVIVVDALFNRQTAKRKAAFLQRLAGFTEGFGERDLIQNVRMIGSNLFAWSLVAQGRADAALMDAVGGFWDAAAGIVLVKEAGGVVTNPLTGEVPVPGCYMMLATNDENPKDEDNLHYTLQLLASECYASYQGFRPPKK